MDDIKYIISYIVEKCLQWLYATRKKRFGHRIIVGIILLVLLVLGLALILYILEAFLLYNCIGNNGADFARILSVVVSTVILIILLNWGTGQDNYSEVLLSYYYLISKRKQKKRSLQTKTNDRRKMKSYPGSASGVRYPIC